MLIPLRQQNLPTAPAGGFSPWWAVEASGVLAMLRKNVASQVVTFNLVNATTGAALTGATVTTKVTLDGTQSAGAGTITELGTGQYKYVPTQGETNGTTAGFSFTATNAVPVNLHCFTIGQDPTAARWVANADQFGGQTVSAAAGVTVPSSIASPTNITAATGVVLSAAGVQAIWDALTSALTTVGSIGKLIVDNLNATITSRMASYTQPTGFLAATFPGTVASTTNITAASGVTIASGGIGSGAHAAAELNAIADATLDRNMATGTDSGTNSTTTRTVRQALRVLRNKTDIAAGTMTVRKEDDSTTSWTAAITTTAGNPVSSSDPT